MPTPTVAGHTLPALRLDLKGHRHVDLRAVFALALPLFLNSSLQVILNLTDTWFIGHLSTTAMAAMAACYYLIFMFFLLLGGVGIGVQAIVAQHFGAENLNAVGRTTWSGLWAALATTPLFLLIGYAGPTLLAIFDLPPEVHDLAASFWFPRMLGGPLSTLLFALNSFFNGISQPRHTLWIMALVALCNALLNEWFIFHWHLGMAGAAWGSTAAQAIGVLIAGAVFLRPAFRSRFHTGQTWRPHWPSIRQVFAIGFPTGLFPAMDVVGLGLFQLMQVKLSAIDGAATQIVMMLTSVSYLPAIGIALAGTTLVGQSIGAGDKSWAEACARVIIRMAVVYMGVVGVLLALSATWVIPPFLTPGDPQGAQVMALCIPLLWIAAGYQVFDALNLSSAFCLRGAGDVKVPTLLLLACSWGIFLPLCHALTFSPGQGWVNFLPQWGWGATGGWMAAFVYAFCLGLALWTRWRSGAWKRISLLTQTQ
ncbi:MATE family efflux transporter [Ferrovum myxofaciens]|uniref:Multidrug-efflux transporter n=1 Tax=Ferrovum myxofaciens TaxID=416213 RepID=A0A149VWR9_9PROT|nr:MATE family efflux transporter [Ferrovum myxofaciens]KXW57681.1 multidrug resistance protein NorM [Ferrovum myxofaciens]QKE41486.1 MAG: MATE family efflux transporter [Ferrovum myxofaciens]